MDTEKAELNGRAPLPEYSESGVDLSLIDWFLALTLAERFDFWEGRMNDIRGILKLGESVDLRQVFRLLNQSAVDFILAGDGAATLSGAPLSTLDVTLIYSIEPSNIDRLARLWPGGDANLPTTVGPFDFLGFIGNNLRYPDLLPNTTERAIGDDIRIRVLNLETIIAIKEQLNTEKDRAALPILRETLRRRQQR